MDKPVREVTRHRDAVFFMTNVRQMSKQRLYLIVLLCLSVMLIPLIAMNFTSAVHWSAGDFFAAGLLLIGLGLGIELVMRKVRNIVHRWALCLALILLLLLLWAELAVGIVS